MNFTFLSPSEERNYAISWIEVETPDGNFVIERGHVPTILLVLPQKPIIFCLKSGKQETILSEGGLLHVTREEITFISYR